MSNAPLDQSGVWRYREMIPFLDDTAHVVTLREGNTPLLNAPRAARVRRACDASGVQASGFQSHRIIQGQRHDVRRFAGACGWG